MSSRIPALTELTTVDKSSDMLVIYDASTDTTKKVNADNIILPQTKTGVAVKFIEDSIYGTPASPETGNIIEPTVRR